MITPEHIPRETIYGNIVSKANNYMAVPAANGEKRIIKNEKVREYERAFLAQIRTYKGKRIDENFILYVDVYFATSVQDLDNSLKTLLDCLQYAGAITDDKFCAEIHASKHIDRQHPRVTFAIQELTPKFF